MLMFPVVLAIMPGGDLRHWWLSPADAAHCGRGEAAITTAIVEARSLGAREIRVEFRTGMSGRCLQRRWVLDA